MPYTTENNETITTLLTRRSVRKFKNEAPPEDLVRKVLEVGSYSPTGMGKQSPLIVWVRNEEDKALLRKLNKSYMAVELPPEADTFYEAPEMILVLADKTAVFTPVEDGSCVLTYMMVAAAALGLGSCWINREKQIFDSAEGKEILTRWGLDAEKYIGVGALALGWPEGDTGSPHPRKPDYILEV